MTDGNRDRMAQEAIRRWMDDSAPDRAPERAVNETIDRLRETDQPRMVVLRLPFPLAAVVALLAVVLIGGLVLRAGLLPLPIGGHPSPSPSPAGCSLEQVAGGTHTFYVGRGFDPNADVELTVNRANGDVLVLTQAAIGSLHTDSEGRFGVELTPFSEDVGQGSLSATAGCTASLDYVVTADQVGPECIDTQGPQTLMDTDAYRAAVFADGPIHWWHFDEHAGLTAADSAGDASGTWQGEPEGVIGDTGTGALFLPGDGGSYVAISEVSVGDFTVEAWVLLCDYADNQDAIVGNGAGPPDLNFFEAQLRLFTGDDVDDAVVSRDPVRIGVWEHWAVSRDATATYVFHNGALVGTGRDWDGQMVITELGRGSSGSLRGGLDEITIYDRALTGEELTAHYDAE